MGLRQLLGLDPDVPNVKTIPVKVWLPTWLAAVVGAVVVKHLADVQGTVAQTILFVIASFVGVVVSVAIAEIVRRG